MRGTTRDPNNLQNRINIRYLHDQARKEVGVPPLLSSDETLNQQCYEWAKQCMAKHEWKHSFTPNIGENIAWRTDDPKLTDVETGILLFNQWYDEKRFFNPSEVIPKCCKGGDCSHYSQIVWKNSTKIGVGLVRDGKWAFLVCQYTPAGNIIGQKCY